MQTASRRAFNGSSFGSFTHITDGHKAVFMAMTAGEPNFCLTSIYVNGQPGVAIVLVEAEAPGCIAVAPCFVSITKGMTLRMMDGEERRF